MVSDCCSTDGRIDNEIKNLWNSSIKKKLKQRGIDPTTHKSISDCENDGDDIPANDKKQSNNQEPTPVLAPEKNDYMVDCLSLKDIFARAYGLSVNPTPPFWFDANTDIKPNTFFGQELSVPSSSSIPGIKPLFDVPSDDPVLQYWNSANSCSISPSSGNNSRNELQLQSNGSLLESDIFRWPEMVEDKETTNWYQSQVRSGQHNLLAQRISPLPLWSALITAEVGVEVCGDSSTTVASSSSELLRCSSGERGHIVRGRRQRPYGSRARCIRGELEELNGSIDSKHSDLNVLVRKVESTRVLKLREVTLKEARAKVGQ